MRLNTQLVVLVVFLFCSVANARQRNLARLVLLNDAPEKHGAMCLDGSPPGFYFRPGFGSGRTKWIVYFQGGGWCVNNVDCAFRSQMFLGSTRFYTSKQYTYDSGILSGSQRHNRDFYNWNLANVLYCDGASFTGYREEPVDVGGTTIYFRGLKIRNAVLEALMNMGMKRATDVILTGCSAGGVAAYIHADYVGSILPPGVKYAVMGDAGIFPAINSQNGTFSTHNSSGGMDQDCIKEFEATNEGWRCFFIQYLLPHISSPLFALNSIHDTTSIFFYPENFTIDPQCLSLSCLGDNLEAYLPKLRKDFSNVTTDLRSREDTGFFFDSCLRHCQSIDDSWFNSVKVSGQFAGETFANWYFGRSGNTRVIDCEEYPCNDSCGTPRDIYGNDSPY